MQGFISAHAQPGQIPYELFELMFLPALDFNSINLDKVSLMIL